MPWVRKSEYERLKNLDRLGDWYERRKENIEKSFHILRELHIWLINYGIEVPPHLTGDWDEDEEYTGNSPPIEGKP